MLIKILQKLLPPGSKGQEHQQNQKKPVDANLEHVIEQLEQIFGGTSDLVLRKLLIGAGSKPALVVYLENMADKKILSEGIIAKLQEAPPEFLDNVKVTAHSILAVSKVSVTADLNRVVSRILSGDTGIFLAGSSRAIIAATGGWETRSIQYPETEVNVEGPKEGFIESIDVNMTLLRRRLRNSNLRFETITLGTRTNTEVAVAHLQGVTDPGIVAEVKRRLKAIHKDGILTVEILHEFLRDQPYSPFPTIAKTERPEKVVACLLEGRVAVLLDGYPFVLVAPMTFAMFLQAGDDYYQSFYYGTFVRWIRIFAFVITLVLPSFYIALVTHHWEMMPTALALSLAGGRAGVPFPYFLEALAMEFTFEVLREAGIRMPRAVGQAVSIVGALVIGQSAVQAGLVSPGIVIIVAFTGIASFAIPVYEASTPFRLLRFPLIFVTAGLGLPGLVAGVMMIWGHMTSLTSFGVPYLAPFVPLQSKDLKDTLFRVPQWAMFTRPQSIPSMDPKRLDDPKIPPEGKDS
ncbi:MAG: spore germination protein [Bacillota bacterium]